MNSTTAQNHEWDGPYTAWGVDADECDCTDCTSCTCGSRLCTDCGVTRHESDVAFLRSLGAGGFWLTFYRIKRRISRLVGR